MTHYLVLSEERSAVDVILDDGTGPMEYWRDYCIVDAASKRAARLAATRHPDMADYVTELRGDDRCPLAHFEVADMTCPHGVCGCDDCRSAYDPDEEWRHPCPKCRRIEAIMARVHDRHWGGSVER